MSGRSEVAKLASRIYRQVGKPDGLDAEALARGYLALERERDALRELLARAFADFRFGNSNLHDAIKDYLERHP